MKTMKYVIDGVRLAVAMLSLATLTACGGGSSEDAPVATRESTLSVDSTPSEVRAADVAAIDRLLETAPSASASNTKAARQAVATAAVLPQDGAAALNEPAAPEGCRLMYFGSLSVRCMFLGEDLYTYLGTDASSVAAPSPYCQEITIGQLQYGVTPVPGSVACYQFTVSTSTSLNFEAVLPAGVVGTAELHHVLPNGAGFPLARSKSPTNPLAGSATAQYQRVILVIRTANGPGNQVFGFGINTTVPQPLPANNVLNDARAIDMNEEVNGELNAPTDVAYYFYPLDAGQTTVMLGAKFNSAHVQIAWRNAKKTGPNTYTTMPEALIPVTSANGALNYLTSGYPANTAGTTTPAGMIVRVTGLGGSAPAKPPFTIRVGARAVSLNSGFDIVNTENLSRWYPTNPPKLQVANYVTAQRIGVKDANGAWVKNHPVRLSLNRNTGSGVVTQIQNFITNHEGKAAVNGVLNTAGTDYPITTYFASGCTGTTTPANNYGPPGTPRDHWNGTAQNGSVYVELLGSYPFVTNTTDFVIQFTRICSETYLGYY